ncbi:helix-turn-helix transcriptional regulator [Phreatobacter stygius]|uniref:Helix-turn-helix domain-containing protein n=1 Tax=Phreatobacter stygius TaxID=1940610 RepID=A0A4D7AXL9_9HYPH|nr:helix-turn-helix transcriptional regulator [Phreatobacter stygius]QCI64225.1 helix-turn-helix domain-containing protein [Phreatobacter stygius]
MHENTYLTTDEAAAYLKLKGRKLYDLVAQGAVPCTKVTGKWLFPRAALDRWLAAGLARPAGFVAEPPPPIVGGSHDPLLEWAMRQSGSGLALLAEGSETGLDRLERNEVAAAAIHLHGATDDDGANITGVAARSGLNDAVVIGFARREQGLVVAPGNPLKLEDLAGAVRAGARFALRQTGAGAQLLLAAMLDRLSVPPESLNSAAAPYPTGVDLALAIRSGEADCGIATSAVAATHGLGFLPVVWERFDLVLRRRSYFEPGPQKLLAFLRRPDFVRRAADFGGYDVSEAGQVRLNM